MKKTKLGLSVCLFLALGGLLGGMIHYTSAKKVPVSMPVVLQSEALIAPAIIDSANDVTKITSLQPGVIQHLHVHVGDVVKKGTPLFSLASRAVQNALKINQLTLKQAKHKLLVQQQKLQFLERQLARFESIDKRAISRAELQGKRQEVKLAKADIIETKYALSLAEESLKNARLTLRQYTTVAPKNGVVLQLNAHENEFINVGPPIVYLGDSDKVIVRVSLDERDAYRFKPDATAYLMTYGRTATKIPLTFIQLDRYIVLQERLNSRVQEALYYFDRHSYQELVAGQLFDAHIDLSATS